MKRLNSILWVCALSSATILVSPAWARGGIALTVSPASIQSDYVGKVTFQVTGMTAGQTVLVERFADLNGNGVIDSTDPLVGSFSVTDGVVPIIGGVRNLNVPGDEDGSANGAVRIE